MEFAHPDERAGALWFTRAPRAASASAGGSEPVGLLAVIGVLRVAAAARPRWRPLLAGVVLTTAGVMLRSGPASVVMLPGMLFLLAAAVHPDRPEEACARRRALERELAAYSTPDQRCDLEATFDRYPDSATGELRDILARQSAAAAPGRPSRRPLASGRPSRGGGRPRPRRGGPRRPGRGCGRPGYGSSGPRR